MRLASFIHAGRASYGIVGDDGIIDLSARLGEKAPDLRTLIATGLDQAEPYASDATDIELTSIRWAPPIPDPEQILCVGLNYRTHVEEVGRPLGSFPTIFLRTGQSQAAHEEPLVRPRVSQQLDYEGELAVVIGRPGRHIAVRDALTHVAGYSLYNDASVRDWQHHSSQYTPGKNFPGTGAFGPWLVTADEIIDPSSLELTTRLNGVEVQRASVSELIFPIPTLIAYLSSFTELRPGDVIVTGTPSGVGASHTPPTWMVAGDAVEVAVAGIGILRNPVVDET